MIDRICISINNRCNMACKYCHFREKGTTEDIPMDVYKILDNVKSYTKESFTIGFVGNGESFLDWPKLKSYISYVSDSPNIRCYTITNGTISLPKNEWQFLEEHNVNVGFSIDGYKELHDKYRCNSFDCVMKNVDCYKSVTGHYPTFNATVGKESIENIERIIDFFKPFGTKVTFSRMIGKYGISLEDYRKFLDVAEKSLFVRRGRIDCTMYGGHCGAGMNNYFFANGNIYYCGNCIDLPSVGTSNTPLIELEKVSLKIDRNICFKESL